MKARVMMIGDYEEESKTYAICLIAEESEVDASPLKEGDEVEIRIANAPADRAAVADTVNPIVCPHCMKREDECDCSDADVCSEMGDK